MSLIGKSISIRKKDVMEQKSIALGFKKIVFAHKANAGESQIDLTALVTPIEMSTNGFVNPPYSTLATTNIKQFRNNLKIISSLSGLLMDYVSYNVVSGTIIKFNGFTAAADEIFTCIIDEAPTTSLTAVDGKTIIASGTLLAGQTDFNIGTPIEINKNPAQHHGAVLVYLDRGLQYRKVGNLTGGDGDYIEVPVPGGLGSLIRFDAAASDRFITVLSNGVVAERPSGSSAALIENLQGQIDQMVPTLAALAGVPESTFQTAPNDVDLKQFGDTVLNQQIEIDTINTILTTKYDIVDGVGKKIGYDHTVGTSFNMGVGDMHGIRVWAPSNSRVTRVGVFLGPQAAGKKIVVGIYSDIGGLPGGKLAQANEYTTAVNPGGTADGGYKTFALNSTVNIIVGTPYWLVIHSDSLTLIEDAYNAPTSGNQKFRTLAYNPILPASFGVPTGNAGFGPCMGGF